MVEYIELKISSAETKEILFEGKNQEISNVSFTMNTINDETLNRSRDVRAEFRIEGKVDATTSLKTKELADWAITNDNDKIYRSIEITVYDGDPETSSSGAKRLRSYSFDDMFVIDYNEIFSDNPDNSGRDNESGKFSLFIAQKQGRAKKAVSGNSDKSK